MMDYELKNPKLKRGRAALRHSCGDGGDYFKEV